MNYIFKNISYEQVNPYSLPVICAEVELVPKNHIEWRNMHKVLNSTSYKELCDLGLGSNFLSAPPKIKDVIYNPPATIVFWTDGTKTVVKCAKDDIYDPEKGLATAIAKKAFGNQGNYYEVFKDWLPRDFNKQTIQIQDYNPFTTAISDIKKKCYDFVKKYYTTASDKSDKSDDTAHTEYKRACDNCGWQDNEGNCYIKKYYACENREHWTSCEFDY